jgi:hypothetical protein
MQQAAKRNKVANFHHFNKCGFLWFDKYYSDLFLAPTFALSCTIRVKNNVILKSLVQIESKVLIVCRDIELLLCKVF